MSFPNITLRLVLPSVLVALSALAAEASILSGLNGITLAEDRDAETAFSITFAPDGTPIIAPVTNITQGTFLLAVAEFPNIIETPHSASNTIASSPLTQMLTGVSLIKVANVPVPVDNNGPPASVIGTYASYQFAAPTQAEWAAVASVFGVPAIAASGDETMILVFDDPPSSPNDHVIASGTISTGLATASNGTLLYEFGLLANSPNTWDALTKVTLGDDPTDIAELLDPVDGRLDFAASLDLIVNHAGPDLAQHNYLSTPIAGNVGQGLIGHNWAIPAHLQLFGVLNPAFPGVPGPPSEWVLPTDTKAYINIVAVPELSSLTAWVVLIAGCSFVGKRTRHAT